jgi:hypothetical protein
MLSGMATAVAFTVGIIVAADGIIAAGIGAVVGTAGGTVAAGCAGGKHHLSLTVRALLRGAGG